MLKIYNTLTGKKEEFRPIKEGEVGMYACGVTVYDHSHLGHARGAVVFDVVVNYMRFRGYKVRYVRNFTDIDDKIINRANELGVGWKEIAEKYTGEYIKDMDALGVGRPTVEPKATEHMDEIIEAVERLIENGYAYESGGDVFFRVKKFEGYGKLSKKPIDEIIAGARVDVDEKKEDPLDFALWKASKPGEPSWDSPWGPGRPGWHIECSAMSIKHLGETFDIHGGGMDLQFPHHENEIAQAEGATGKPFVHYWMHNGFVNVNKEKMSKSLGNFFTIKDILARYRPEAIRLFLLGTHYRNPIDFSDQSLNDAKAALDRFYTMKAGLDSAIKRAKDSSYEDEYAELHSELSKEISESAAGLITRFKTAMDDDFNTAAVVGALFELVRDVNKALADELAGKDLSLIMALDKVRQDMDEVAGILGVFGSRPSDWFGQSGDTVTLKEGVLSLNEEFKVYGVELKESDGGVSIAASDIESLIQKRNEARKGKDWATADGIRDLLMKSGIELLDGPDGTKWQA